MRIVICVDMVTDSPTEAYKQLLDIMEGVEQTRPEVEGWESTDEWFGADGEQLENVRELCLSVLVAEERIKGGSTDV